MAKKEKEPEQKTGGAPGWMVTYGDMMSLLLTFFVLILSFSSIQEVEFKKAIGSLRGSLGILGKYEYLISMGKIIVPDTHFSFMTLASRQTTGEISKKLNFVSDYENVEVYTDTKGTNIILPAEVLFEPGDDALKESAEPMLRKIGAFLYEIKRESILIEGHTDNQPISSMRFPTNWHLSASRAISVARFFHDTCAIENTRMTVCGHGEYRPIVPNDTIENRARNRRVGILIQGDVPY